MSNNKRNMLNQPHRKFSLELANVNIHSQRFLGAGWYAIFPRVPARGGFIIAFVKHVHKSPGRSQKDFTAPLNSYHSNTTNRRSTNRFSDVLVSVKTSQLEPAGFLPQLRLYPSYKVRGKVFQH